MIIRWFFQADWPAYKCPDVNVIDAADPESFAPSSKQQPLRQPIRCLLSIVYFGGPINAIVTFTHVSFMNDRIILSQNSSKRRRDVLSTFCERFSLKRPLIFYITLVFLMSRSCRIRAEKASLSSFIKAIS